MSEDYAREKAYALVKAAVQSYLPGTKVQAENTKFVQPPNAPWVKVSVQPVMSKRKDIGSVNRIFRHFGVVNCTILVPEDSGMKVLTEMSSAIFLALADQRFAIPGGGYLTFCHAKRANRGRMNGFQSAGVMVEYHVDMNG